MVDHGYVHCDNIPYLVNCNDILLSDSIDFLWFDCYSEMVYHSV